MLDQGVEVGREMAVEIVDAVSVVAIDVECDERIQVASYQMGRPVVHGVHLTNGSERRFEGLVLTVAFDPKVADTLELHIGVLEAGGSLTIPGERIGIELSAERLVNQTERERGRIVVELRAGEELLGRRSQAIEILAYNEWAGNRLPMEMIAAFVTPNHSGVAKFLELTRGRLKAARQEDRLDGYQSKDPQRVGQLAVAVYESIGAAGIKYSNPPASFQESGQKVRTAEQVLGDGVGTCLDLCVLMAGALEQIGLNTLIVFIQGHAFVGVWVHEWHLPDAMVDSAGSIRKRVELGECLVFDSSSAAEGVGFLTAVERGKAFLKDEQSFWCAVDVAAARARGIHPLRLQRESVWKPVERAVDTKSLGQKGAARVRIPVAPNLIVEESSGQRIDRWKRQLLDLSLRNRLINHKDTLVSMPLSGGIPGEIENKLVEGQRLQLRARQPGDSKLSAVEVTEMAGRFVGQSRLLVDLSEVAFDKRASEIYRRNRNIVEESGTTALYLAFGMLQWFESKTSKEPLLAPIILVPVVLERERVSGPYYVKPTDDEPLINQTIVEKLQAEFGIKLPTFSELPRDEYGVDVDGILRLYLQALKDVDRFDVIWRADLAIYEFQNFMLWLDLEQNAKALQSNPIVRHLLDSEGARFPGSEEGGGFVRAETLDVERASHVDLSVMDSDSSQLAAVFSAIDGHSFVLQGPPGTGKSQTITNLIAQLLGRGKTVLFVSQKRAALEVVQSRLEQVGLGPFTLELHSDRASKADVIRQLEEPLKYQWSEQIREWDAQASLVQVERDRLNAYAKTIHQVGPFGESLYQSLGRLIELREGRAAGEVHLDFGRLPDRVTYLGLREAVQDLAAATKQLGSPAENPFRGAGHIDWTPQWQRSVEAAQAQAVGDGAKQLEDFAGLAVALGAVDEGQGFAAVDVRLSRALHALFVVVGGVLVDGRGPSAAMLSWPSARVEDVIARSSQYLRARELAQASVGTVFLPTIYKAVDVAEERARFERWAGAFFLWAFIMLFSARKKLKQFAVGGLGGNKEVAKALEGAVEVARTDEGFAGDVSDAAELLGYHWQGENTSQAVISDVWKWTAAFRQALIRVEELSPVMGERLRSGALWAGVQDPGERLGEGTAAGRALRQFLESDAAFDASYAVVVGLLAFEEAVDGVGARLAQLEQWTGAAGTNQLRDWCDWKRRADAVGKERALLSLVAAMVDGRIAADDLSAQFERGLRERFVDEMLVSHGHLRQFRGFEHDHLIARFQEHDQALQALARREVQARLAARLPDRGAPGEMEVLRHEFKKRRMHKPIRRLFAEAPEAILRLKPCMLMSPLAVARYLDPSLRHFDVVVFDEASQIPPWDAVGAIGRGRQAIIVGDSRQLPPTSFFASAGAEQDDEEMVEFESILDHALVAGMPECTLDWHYRSRHESLIAFSNHHYYDSRLHIFPSPEHEVAHLGVKLISVENGYYDRGDTATNHEEARAVVAEIVRRLRDPALQNRSIGVVTFSQAQQRCIEDLLDSSRRKYPEIEPYFQDVAEPVFVKNLENVQGDERDVMLFSVCYGPDQTGRVTMNFGPLNREGGERRLNVAVTRARELLMVFSTLRADQIDLSRTNAMGVRHLKAFLDYAGRGAGALGIDLSGVLAGVSAGGGANAADGFLMERDVAGVLRGAGWTVHERVGVADFRIDLAVEDPERSGAYLLGILFDGGGYHSAKTARDRDRVRRGVLGHLGWELHQVWSLEWWFRREDEVERLLERVREINERPRAALVVGDGVASGGVASGGESVDVDVLPPVLDEDALAKKSAMRWPAYAEPWRGLVRVRLSYESAAFYEDGSNAAIEQEIERQLAVGPLDLETLGRQVSACWRCARYYQSTQQRIVDVIEAGDVARIVGDTVWPAGLSEETWRGFRYADGESPARELGHVVDAEIRNAAEWLEAYAIGLERDNVAREVCVVLGFARVTGRVLERVVGGLGGGKARARAHQGPRAKGRRVAKALIAAKEKQRQKAHAKARRR